ncbi:MAG: hypothetical protein NTW19_15470 [Planctomycetota bacterium]|nr:hypothetical protein [Planctomycetota bacterium]
MATEHTLQPLRRAMELAGTNLLASLSPDHGGLPYWCVDIDAKGKAGFRMWWPGHNLGRWWDAMLRLEAATGFRIPVRAEADMRRNLVRFLDNPDHLCLEPVTAANHKDYALDLHSLREGMLALHALVRWRGDRWALEQGKRMVASLDRLTRDPAKWDLRRFALSHKARLTLAWGGDPTASHGRLIEALVWFAEATGHAPALALADRLAMWHVAHTFTPDGRVSPKATEAHHSHSVLGTLRGIALLGLATGRQELVDLTARAMRVTVLRLVKPSGYTCHDLLLDRRGETTTPGDAAQLALWLAKAGYGEFWDDAQRIVRCRILPSQILAPPPLEPAGDPALDPWRDISKRCVGAFGGMHAHPHGETRPTTDITAADLHTLIDVAGRVVESTPQGVRVNLHLDHDGELAAVRVVRGQRAKVEVRLKAAARGRALWIRVPRWADAESVLVRVDGKRIKPVRSGDYVVLDASATKAAGLVTLEHDLPVREQVEPTDGVEYRLSWRGDDLMEVQPPPDALPFYPRGAAVRQREYECSPLQLAVKEIARAKSPPPDLTFTPVKDVTRDERFANIRAFHEGRDGLLYIRTVYRHFGPAGAGLLRYGADAPVAVFVNGKRVGLRRGGSPPARAEAHVARTRWRRGENVIIFALATEGGRAWGVFAKVDAT